MKVVYVCSPLSGDIEGNMRKAADFCAFTKDLGYVPYAPHLLFTDFMDDTIDFDCKSRGIYGVLRDISLNALNSKLPQNN